MAPERPERSGRYPDAGAGRLVTAEQARSAEGVGFEPTVTRRLQRLSRPTVWVSRRCWSATFQQVSGGFMDMPYLPLRSGKDPWGPLPVVPQWYGLVAAQTVRPIAMRDPSELLPFW